MPMLSVRRSVTMYISSHPPLYSKPTSQRSPGKKQVFFYQRAQCQIKLPSGLTCSSPHIRSSQTQGLTYTGKFSCPSRHIFSTLCQHGSWGRRISLSCQQHPNYSCQWYAFSQSTSCFVEFFVCDKNTISHGRTLNLASSLAQMCMCKFQSKSHSNASDTRPLSAPTRIIALENTLNGTVIPQDDVLEISKNAHSR